MFTCYYKTLPRTILLCLIIILLCSLSIFDHPQSISDTHDKRGYECRVHQRVHMWKVKISSTVKDQQHTLRNSAAISIESHSLNIKSMISQQHILYKEINNMHIRSLLKSLAYNGEFSAFETLTSPC